MKKTTCSLIFGCVISGFCFTQALNSEHITMEITNVAINSGKVFVTIYSNTEGYRNGNPYLEFELEANNTMLLHELTLPTGEYVISLYQDANNNQRLDYGLFGIPKELVGLSNYSGKGFPSRDFNRQKISVNNLTGTVTIGLYKF